MQNKDGELAFGLDIGTRNVVGTVGYKKDDEFYVVAQCKMEHETRSMLDGQIHDIGRVDDALHRFSVYDRFPFHCRYKITSFPRNLQLLPHHIAL